jgi:hypothetical protein
MNKVRSGTQTIPDLTKLRQHPGTFPNCQCDPGNHYSNKSCQINNLKTLWTNVCKAGKRIYVNFHYLQWESQERSSLFSFSILRSRLDKDYHFVSTCCLNSRRGSIEIYWKCKPNVANFLSQQRIKSFVHCIWLEHIGQWYPSKWTRKEFYISICYHLNNSTMRIHYSII